MSALRFLFSERYNRFDVAALMIIAAMMGEGHIGFWTAVLLIAVCCAFSLTCASLLTGKPVKEPAA